MDDAGERMEIEIRSWEKYNPKRDQKSYTWLRLNNDLLTNPDLYTLDPVEKLVWVLLLCEASKKNKALFTLNLNWFSAYSKIDRPEIERILTKIQGENLISINPNAELRSCADVKEYFTTPTNERTYVRTNVRTDVLKFLKKDFEPSISIEAPMETDLNPEEISSALSGIISQLKVGGA